MVNYTRKAISGFTIILSVTLLGVIVGYFFRLVLARNVTVAEYGLFYSVYALLYLFFILRDFGIGSALIKYVPDLIVKKNYSRIKSIIITSTIITLFLSIVFMIIAMFLSGVLATYYLKTPSAGSFMRLMSIVFVFFALEALCVNILSAFQRYWLYSLYQFLRQALPLGILIFLFTFSKDITGAAYSLMLTSIILIILFIALFYKNIMPGFIGIKYARDKVLTRKLLKFGLSVVFISIGGLILQYTDTLMITALMNTTSSGIYNAAVPISSIIIYISAALSTLAFPLTSELWARRLRKTIVFGMNVFYRYSFMILLPFCMIMIAYSDLIITTLFGPEYISATMPLRILIVGTMFYLIAQTNFSLLSGMGKPNSVAKITLFGALINIALNFILILSFGITGAAISTAICYIIMSFLSVMGLKKHIPIRFPFLHWFKTILLSLATIGIIFWLKQIVTLSVYLKMGVILGAATLFYLGTSYLFKQIDIHEIKELIKEIMKK